MNNSLAYYFGNNIKTAFACVSLFYEIKIQRLYN